MSSQILMLIDDNKIDLFIHNEVIKRIPYEKTILQYVFAGDAITYLTENDISKWPDVILLDIHMPIMNGFDFLIEYAKLPKELRDKCRVIMVSSSLDTEDLKKAKLNSEVFDYLEKPLNMEKLYKILNPVK